MTDRLKGVTVGFSSDIREDDAERIIEAIEMIKGVQIVEPIKLESGDSLNRERIKHEYRKMIFDALDKIL